MRFARRSAVVMLSALAHHAAAQTAIDDGNFTFYVNGAPSGHERFWFTRGTGAGSATILAKAVTTIGARRIESTMRDSAGRVQEFMVEEFAGAQLATRARGAAAGGLFSLRVVTPVGPSDKDLRLPPGTVVSDHDMVHQFFFIARAGTGARIPVLDPRQLSRDSLTLTVRPEGQAVEVGNGTVPARHLIATDSHGVATDIWVDAKGRLLRVEVRSRGFIAKRDEPPPA